MISKPILSLVIPCFNEEEVITDTFEKLNSYKTELVQKGLISSKSLIIFVDDGSKDNTWKIFDVLLDGSVSEIATKKSEFRIYIKEKKIDELIKALKKFNGQTPSWVYISNDEY